MARSPCLALPNLGSGSQIEPARSGWKSDRVTLRGKIGKSSRLFLSNRQSLLAHSGCDPRKIQTHPWVVKLHPEVSLTKFVAEVPNSAIFDVGSKTSLVFAIASSERAM
jgi:hypothetical protein